MPSKITPVTVGQVAERAGLSRQTVSNILNEKGHLFRAETRELVLRVADELGYRPNSIAKALRSGRFNSIGLLSSIDQRVGSVAPEALAGIHSVLRERDLHLVSGRYSDDLLVDKSRAPKVLRELMADGLIINYTHLVPSGLLDLVNTSPMPAIWFNSIRDADAVRPDDRQGGRIATEYLLGLGHRRIAFVNLLHSEAEIRGLGRPLHYSIGQRHEGYQEAMKNAGLTPQLIARCEDVTETRSVGGPFLWLEGEDRPTALIFHSEGGLVPLIIRLGELGLRMPRDLSAVLFTNGDYNLAGLAFDQVIVPHYKIGEAAVRALLRKIEAPRTLVLPPLVIPCELRPLFATAGPHGRLL